MKIALAGLVAALGLVACATSQVSPVARFETKRICVIENPKVRGDFLIAYRKVLEDRGFQVQMFPETAQPNVCPVTSRYVAYFWWDMVFYMRQAEIDVYSDGKHAGRASFDARGSRFFGTEEKVKELVDQLFPR
jgi:hypothetical protein